MNLLTRAQFARLIGCHKSTVTRLGQDGRLVERDGLVDPDLSAARIEATRGARPDVADRWAEARAAAGRPPMQPALQPPAPAAQLPLSLPPGGDQGDDGEPLGVDEIGIRTRRAKMLSAEADARARERADLLAAGEIIPRAEVRADLVTAAGLILAALEPLPDRLSPLLVGVTDAAAVRAILHDDVEQTLRAIAGSLDAVARGGQ